LGVRASSIATAYDRNVNAAPPGRSTRSRSPDQTGVNGENYL
jgi:hypothetical protein